MAIDESTSTTEGCTRADVEQAMAELGIHNPKPEIPLELTLSGHEIVALARNIKELHERIDEIEDELDGVAEEEGP